MVNPNIPALIVSEILAFIRTDGYGKIDSGLILIKNIYILWGRKGFLLPVMYFPSNLNILLLNE